MRRTITVEIKPQCGHIIVGENLLINGATGELSTFHVDDISQLGAPLINVAGEPGKRDPTTA